MSSEILRIAIVTAFKNGYKTGLNSFSPVQYQNQAFTEPEAALWTRFSLIEDGTAPTSIGKNQRRTIGILNLQVFVPKGSGTKPANEVKDKVASFLDYLEISPASGHTIIFDTTKIRFVQESERWGEHLVSCNFRYDIFT